MDPAELEKIPDPTPDPIWRKKYIHILEKYYESDFFESTSRSYKPTL